MEIQSRNIYAHLWNFLKKNEHVKNDFLRQSTSLQITVLRVKDNINKIVIVANTHLYYHPDANHIRLLQATMATLYLSNVRRKYQKVSFYYYFVNIKPVLLQTTE